jgi:hypothetical protein
MQVMEVRRGHLDEHRVVDEPVPAAGDGEAVLRIDTFGFSANNITYAAYADMLRYWDHFPAADPAWGRVPVWGFAEVLDSGHPDLPVGERLFGYLPMATHVVIAPDRVTARDLHDASPHRSALAAAYTTLTRTAGDALYDPGREPEQMLLRPLFFTAFLIDDHLDDTGGTEGAVVLSSASSKTAIGTAFLLHRRGTAHVVGLTSASNRAFVEGLGIYDEVRTYDEVGQLERRPAVFLDFAGDAGARQSVHRHYGDDLTRSVIIGGTHWDAPPVGDPLPGPAPSMFFAPDQVRKRTAEWGQTVLDERLGAATRDFYAFVDGWLRIERHLGADEVAKVYDDALAGRIDPSVGLVLSMRGAR